MGRGSDGAEGDSDLGGQRIGWLFAGGGPRIPGIGGDAFSLGDLQARSVAVAEAAPTSPCRLTADEERLIKSYVAQNLPNIDVFPAWTKAIGWEINDGEKSAYVGGVVLWPRGGGFDAELSIYLSPRCRLTKQHIEVLFGIAFHDLGLKRLTCKIARGNHKSRRFVERLGFRKEGSQKRAFDGVQAAIIYGMTREDCRWLEKMSASDGIAAGSP